MPWLFHPINGSGGSYCNTLWGNTQSTELYLHTTTVLHPLLEGLIGLGILRNSFRTLILQQINVSLSICKDRFNLQRSASRQLFECVVVVFLIHQHAGQANLGQCLETIISRLSSHPGKRLLGAISIACLNHGLGQCKPRLTGLGSTRILSLEVGKRLSHARLVTRSGSHVYRIVERCRLTCLPVLPILVSVPGDQGACPKNQQGAEGGGGLFGRLERI